MDRFRLLLLVILLVFRSLNADGTSLKLDLTTFTKGAGGYNINDTISHKIIEIMKTCSLSA